MVIETTKAFDKQYAKLNLKVKTSFKRRVELFKVNPFDISLRNHALKGKYLGYRSIDVTGDVRALYTTQGDTIIIFGFLAMHLTPLKFLDT
jgi:mRNA-degrading endonuclease YafQ of YafQ-DinJ toxin-antitoxin module